MIRLVWGNVVLFLNPAVCPCSVIVSFLFQSIQHQLQSIFPNKTQEQTQKNDEIFPSSRHRQEVNDRKHNQEKKKTQKKQKVWVWEANRKKTKKMYHQTKEKQISVKVIHAADKQLTGKPVEV